MYMPALMATVIAAILERNGSDEREDCEQRKLHEILNGIDEKRSQRTDEQRQQ